MKLVPAKCPSCGASIKVDRSLKFTKCEYCNTEIVVEEAVENLLKVELKDTPTFDNYLKLGNRYFDNKEFVEAYKAYSKAEEIEPDNPLVILRKGLCKSMISDYNNFEVSSAINGLKTSMDLMKKMSFSKKEIYQSIDEVGAVLFVSKNYLVDIYKNNKLTKSQTSGYIERMESCLDGFIYLDSLVEGDSNLEQKIVHEIVSIIDIILGNANDTKYHLSSSYVTELKNRKKEYSSRLLEDHSYTVKEEVKKEKVVEVDSNTSKIKDFLCYAMIAVLGIMLLGSIFNHESFFIIFVWLLTIVSFIPKLKKILVQKNGSNIGKIIVWLRVLLLLACFVLLASGPSPFENTYKGEDGTKITLRDGKISIVTQDTEIVGTYYWDTKDEDYYIHAKGKNVDEDMEYRYRENDEGGSLCLLENDQCSTIYLPVE